MVDELTVQVCTVVREPIPGRLRYEWMRSFFGGVNVVHNDDENPQDPADDPEHFWDIWRDSLLAHTPGNRSPDYVFASESYGVRLAQELRAAFVPVDPKREVMPISATLLRGQPLRYWEYLLPTARPHFISRVAIVGPESAGKSTLAPELARHFNTVHVPEYGRTYQENIRRDLVVTDMDCIIRAHICSEDAVAMHSNGLLIVDTEAVVSKMWSRVFFNTVSDALEAQCLVDRYKLYLVATPHEEWDDDGWRLQPNIADRWKFCNEIVAELQRLNRTYALLTGSWKERRLQAIGAVEKLRHV
jgi:NadR type nicotinamide-nucleotide adenylyltransferase